MTFQLIERIKQVQERGLIVVMDNFGVDYLPNKGGSKRITNVLSEDSQEVQDVGVAFKILDSDVKLDEIIVALTTKNNNAEVEIQLVSDINGKPNPSQILESFHIKMSNLTSPISLKSTIKTTLVKDSQYWLLFSMLSRDGQARLWFGPINFMPRFSIFAERSNGEDWRVLESITGPGYAIRIIGHPIS